MANEINTLGIGGVDYSIIDTIYPVGSIYMSVNSANPGTIFGGTWEQIKGRFLLGTGTCDDNTDSTFGTIKNKTWSAPAGTKGGEDFNQLAEGNLPAHTHPAATGNDWGITEMRNVADISGIWPAPLGTGSHITFGAVSDGTNYLAIQGATGSTGNNVAHNNMPPYFSVYIWRRTA